MKYCKSCNMKYDTDQTKCVFCNNELETLDNTPGSANYPPFKGFYPWQEIVLKYILFGVLSLLAVAIIVDLYLFPDHNLPLLVFVSGIYIYICFLLLSMILNPI